MGDVVNMARTKTCVDTTKAGEISITITGIPTKAEASPTTIAAFMVIAAYEAVEDWCKDCLHTNLPLPELVEGARELINLKVAQPSTSTILKCVCKGFYKPAHCPVHGNKKTK